LRLEETLKLEVKSKNEWSIKIWLKDKKNAAQMYSI